jgi:hypothetical protein
MLGKLLEFIPKEVLSLIFGKLLGDGNLTIEKHRKPRFRFQHCYSDLEWGYHCYNSLKSFIPLSPPQKRITSDPRLIKGYSESVYVQSRTSLLFILLCQIWYQDNKKIIPFDILSLIFDEVGLAWWYQDDGHLSVCNNKVKKIILSTDNFSEAENELLIKLLKQKFNLSFSIDGQNRLCLYDQQQILYFLHIVDPYIHFSMNRKKYQLDNMDQSSIIPLTKRTTISLPLVITIKSPTKDITTIIEHINLESFIHNWFNIWYLEKSLLLKNSDMKKYQIVINKNQQWKLECIKNLTGLKMNEIVYLASIFQ